MTASTGSIAYQRGLELAEAGQYGAALSCIEEHLRARPNDAQALNDAGAIVHCLGRSNDAIGYLVKARELQPDSGEIVWNLMEAYLATARAAEAVSLIAAMERMGILNIDVMNRLATQLLNQGKKGLAADVLLKSKNLWPNQEILTPILDIIRSKRPKVAFFGCRGGREEGLGQIRDYVKERFQTQFYESDHVDDDTDVLQWSDIAWFDGGGQKVVDISQTPHNEKIVVSLRRSDTDLAWMKQVRWENIDILIQMGARAVDAGLERWVPNIRNRTRLAVIPSGVDVDRYSFGSRPRGKHLACMDGLTSEANPGLLIQCMQKVHYIDPEYQLFFAGRFQDSVLERYLRHMVQTLGLTGVVHFEPTPADWNTWLSDKHYVVTGGVDEGPVDKLLIGMACGLKPVIHNFPGADSVFPSEYLFNIAEDFCRRVLEDTYDPAGYHRFVREQYAIDDQLRSMNEILEQLESEIEWQRSRSSKGDGSSIVAVEKPRASKTTAASV